MKNSKSVRTRIKNHDGEFCVELYVNGQHIENADYFTDDQQDALETAKDMLKRA